MMIMMRRSLLLLFFFLVPICWARRRKDGNPLSRGIVVKNQAGVKIDFFWVNPNTKELAASTSDGGVTHGGESSISSYIGHTFEVQELPKKKTGKCEQEKCRITHFTVSANEDPSKEPERIQHVYLVKKVLLTVPFLRLFYSLYSH
jgi:hypothetical protein